MKTTAFKVFASCITVVCLASPSVSRAASDLKSVLGTSENPIIEKQGIEQLKYLFRQNVVDFKPYDSKLISNEMVQELLMAVHDPMLSHRLYRKRRSYDPKVERRLKKEIEGDDSRVSVDLKVGVRVFPDLSNEVSDYPESNEVQNSQQSNDVQQSQQSNEDQSFQQSNEVQSSQQSDEVQDSQQSDEVQDSQQSDEVQDSSLQSDLLDSQELNEEDVSKDETFELNESDDIYGSEESSDDSSNDDEEESIKSSPSPFQRTTF
ncbi:PREDICTED: uncharacterized protein LOC107161332 [Diuraphis noxia]|uniref:uncharacterized protein LOC107161332 n=1 Tax=Diuraphis noxia TaxID=143948 RepID=UPI0007637193|nr:PREDICTED: uncharacterized protein LOC107161332 [Diuraphis noxia]